MLLQILEARLRVEIHEATPYTPDHFEGTLLAKLAIPPNQAWGCVMSAAEVARNVLHRFLLLPSPLRSVIERAEGA